MGLFAAVYGFGPWDTARLTVWEYDRLEAEATDWLKIKAGYVGGDD